jgi:hypothetical protein
MTEDLKELFVQARESFARVHRYATHDNAPAYMSVPADPKRDADLLHVAALDALEREVEALEAHLDAVCSVVGHSPYAAPPVSSVVALHVQRGREAEDKLRQIRALVNEVL